jgi:Tol biopolymer transport system component
MSSTRVVAIVVGIAVLVGAAAGVGFLLARDGEAVARGDLIAYTCKEPPRNAWYAICTMKIDGSEKRRVTSGLSTSDPDWSPDGRKIAFTRNEDVGESTTFTDDDVFVMDSDGDDLRRLTPERDGLMSGQPTWSPDGRKIAFMRGQSVASTVPSRFGDLFVMAADGTDVRRLARGPANAPTWSPDGREIAFARGERLSSMSANTDVYVVDAAGGEPRRLTRSKSFDETPAWSPDASRIAFVRSTFQSQFDGKVAIYVIDRDGTGERLVLEHQLFAPRANSVSWSPDGQTIAFETSATIGCVDVALVVAEGGPVRRLTSCTKPREIAEAPAWQPAVATEGR